MDELIKKMLWSYEGVNQHKHVILTLQMCVVKWQHVGTHSFYMFVEIVSPDFSQLELIQSAALYCSSWNGDVIGLIFSAGVYTVALFPEACVFLHLFAMGVASVSHPIIKMAATPGAERFFDTERHL